MAIRNCYGCTKMILFVILNSACDPANAPRDSTYLAQFENNNNQVSIKFSRVQEDIFNASAPTFTSSDISQTFDIRARTNHASTPLNLYVYPNDTKNYNFTFDERKREDAFEKRPAKESPYAVLLLMYWGKSDTPAASCSGSLLTPDWVLTASHCLVAPDKKAVSKISVYAGGYSYDEVMQNRMPEGAQLRDSRSFFPHPKYNDQAADFDVGLVRVAESFEMTDTVGTVPISARPWRHRGYRRCRLTGFGIVQIGDRRADDKVRKTHTLDVKKPCLCAFRLQVMYGRTRAGRYACARPRDDHGVCQGDSGGGLVCDGEVCAVAMQLVALFETYTCDLGMFTHNLKCGAVNALTVFQDTCPFLRWLNSHVKLLNDSNISYECVEKDAAARPLRGGGLYVLALVLANVLVNVNVFAG